jgi:hypothetical protein
MNFNLIIVITIIIVIVVVLYYLGVGDWIMKKIGGYTNLDFLHAKERQDLKEKQVEENKKLADKHATEDENLKNKQEAQKKVTE